jgi:membrane associated rhomboid family serine protease
MREPSYQRRRLSASVILMMVITVAFAFQQINEVYIRKPFEIYLALSRDGISRGFLWQFLTFQFLHGGGLHLIFNLIGIWFFGRFVEERLGASRMLRIYFTCGGLGGLMHIVMAFVAPQFFGLWPVFGASAGVCGLLAAFATIEPDATILLFFVIPMRARHLLIASVGIALFFTVVPSDPGIAHAAHLGGLLGGIGYIRRGLHWEHLISGRLEARRLRPRRANRELVKTPASTRAFWQRSPLTEDGDLSTADFISKEVDPILDKISAHGIQSLTERERKILEAARAKMAKGA